MEIVRPKIYAVANLKSTMLPTDMSLREDLTTLSDKGID